MTRFHLLLVCHHILDSYTEASSKNCIEKSCFLNLIYAKCLEQWLAHSNSIEVLAIITIHDDEVDGEGLMHYKHIFTSTSVNFKKKVIQYSSNLKALSLAKVLIGGWPVATENWEYHSWKDSLLSKQPPWPTVGTFSLKIQLSYLAMEWIGLPWKVVCFPSLDSGMSGSWIDCIDFEGSFSQSLYNSKTKPTQNY